MDPSKVVYKSENEIKNDLSKAATSHSYGYQFCFLPDVTEVWLANLAKAGFVFRT